MKTFSTLINESTVLTLPRFKHKDLNDPRDPEGKFWKAIESANEDSEKASKNIYDKALKLAKELYGILTDMPEDDAIANAKFHIRETVSEIEKSADGAIESMTIADQKFLRNCIHTIQTIDEILSHKRFYKDTEVDVKAGYVPFKGAAKDPKIKYRIVVRSKNPIPDPKIISRLILSATPITKDYVAGVEWNRDQSAFAVLITNSPGYKR